MRSIILHTLRVLVVAAGLATLAASQPGTAATQDHDQDPQWVGIRKMMFGDREVHGHAEDVVKVWVRNRAEDASTVPVTISTYLPQDSARYIRTLWLVIDNNPSPVGVRFTMSPESGRADIETRIRIESFTPVRAVAELSDGSLWMSTATVMAAGGCSSPGPKAASDLAQTGRMKFKVDEIVALHKPVLAQLMVRHPNYSGLGTGAEPAYFVKQVTVMYGERQIMRADVDFTISENPNFRFYFVPDRQAELRAEVVDTQGLRFEQSVVVTSPLFESAPVTARQ
jgi:sulfur-oxidizing protein SoxY